MTEILNCLQAAPYGRFVLDGLDLRSGDRIEIHISQVWKEGKIIDDVWLAGQIRGGGGLTYVFETPAWGRPLPLMAGMTARLTEIGACTCGAKFYARTDDIDDHVCMLEDESEGDR